MTRFAGERLSLDQLKGLFASSQPLMLGAGKQGSVVSANDGLLAIKRQPLAPSEQERRHGASPDQAAYMAEMAGRHGIGPKVFQYEVDPTEGQSYLSMENLRSKGYTDLSEVLSSDQERYKALYATQMLREIEAAKHGIGLNDTHASNVMVNPATGKLMFIDYGYAKPVAAGREPRTSDYFKAQSGLMNLDKLDQFEYNKRENLMSAARRSGDKTRVNQLINDAVAELTASIPRPFP